MGDVTQFPPGAATIPPAKDSLISRGVNVLLEGPSGTGKTTSLGTIADSGVELFVLFTENGQEALMGHWTDYGKPVPPNVHWATCQPFERGFATLAESAEKVNTIALDAWAKITDPNRGQYSKYVSMLRMMADFKDERTGKSFGAVDSWGPDRCFAIDSMTGLGALAMALVIGGKPVKSLPEWGAAQDQLERLVRQICDGCKCHFVLTAHIERETDQVFGGVKITMSTLGSKLAPKLVPMFSDVILSYREGTKFMWSTMNPQADLKTRNLPIADGLPQDFGPIFKKWRSRGGAQTV